MDIRLLPRKFFAVPKQEFSLFAVLGNKALDAFQRFDDLIFGGGVAGAHITFAAGTES